MDGLLDQITALREALFANEEDLAYLTHVIGNLYSELLERIDPGLSTKHISYPSTKTTMDAIEDVSRECPGLYWLPEFDDEKKRKRPLQCNTGKVPDRVPKGDVGDIKVCKACYMYSYREYKKRK